MIPQLRCFVFIMGRNTEMLAELVDLTTDY